MAPLGSKLFLLRHRAFLILDFQLLPKSGQPGEFSMSEHTKKCLTKVFEKPWVKYRKHTCERRDISPEWVRRFLTSAEHNSNELQMHRAQRVEAER